MLIERGVAIVSTSGDAHAKIISSEINRRGVQCHIFETDMISTHAFSHAEWINGKQRFISKNTDGKEVDILDLSVCWWRRTAQTQRRKLEDQSILDGISSDASRHLFIGGFLSNFKGELISSPQATIIAENKLFQLSLAVQSGLRIPETIVSNNFEEIFAFGDRHQGRLIVKSLCPFNGRMVETLKLEISQLDKIEITLVPSIYQEFIDGYRHIRAIVFGSEIILVGFETADIDWRKNVPENMVVIPDEYQISEKLKILCRLLNLKMGVADFKINNAGEAVFFEMNPQGQFLFVEPYINKPITSIFAEFLLQNALQL